MTSAFPMPESVLVPLGFFANRDRFPITLPKVNAKISKHAFHIEIVAPGFKKEEINMEIKDRMLSVRASHQKMDESEKEPMNIQFENEPFEKVINLPQNADIDKIDAKYRNGIIYIDIPKIKFKEEEEPKKLVVH
jgi:HSP20 family protein